MRYLLVPFLLVALVASAVDVSLPLTFCREQNAMTVTVEVNGKPHRFIVDTGAELTIVSHEVVGLSLVDLREAAFSQSGPGLKGDAIFVRANLRLGNRTWQERLIVAMDLQAVRSRYGKDVDGLLGQDLLREFSSVKVDFKNRQLVLAN